MMFREPVSRVLVGFSEELEFILLKATLKSFFALTVSVSKLFRLTFKVRTSGDRSFRRLSLGTRSCGLLQNGKLEVHGA